MKAGNVHMSAAKQSRKRPYREAAKLGAATKRARKIRTEDEFAFGKWAAAIALPPEATSVYSWSLSEIWAARDQQLRGNFAQPARLAASMRTDDALSVARANRLAPRRCLKAEMIAANETSRAKTIADESEGQYGEKGIAISEGTLADIHGALVDHGIAFAYNIWTPRDDGTRVDVEIRYFPIEHVRWDDHERVYKARVAPEFSALAFSELVITHGDGRWIIFSAFDHKPFAQEAAILAGSLVWARHAFAVRDWAKSSVAHGSAKVIGEMPEGVALQTKDGLTPEAMAMAELLRAIATSDAPVGLRPSGAKTEFLTNNSSAWQIFVELTNNAEKAAARIYLGTDGTLGAQGGAPGVDVAALFGVASTKVQGDLGTIERCIGEGSVHVWTAINFGDSTLAPSRHYLLPDADADAARASVGTRRQAFYADLAQARANGFVIDQDFVADLAAQYDIDPPKLPEGPAATVDPNYNPNANQAPVTLPTIDSAPSAAAAPALRVA